MAEVEENMRERVKAFKHRAKWAIELLCVHRGHGTAVRIPLRMLGTM